MNFEVVSEDDEQVTIKTSYALYEVVVTLNKKTKRLTQNGQGYSFDQLNMISIPASLFLKSFL